MAAVARRIMNALSGAAGELVPGAFEDSDPQLSLTLPNGVPVSVLPDADSPTRYEVLRLDTMALVGDRLTTQRVIEVLRAEAGLQMRK